MCKYELDSRRQQDCDVSDHSLSGIQNWHADYSLSSPQARQWQKQNQQSRQQPLRMNEADDTYIVQHGDCLSTIAARELQDAGKAVNKNSVAQEMQEIIALNRDKYNTLDDNQDYLAAGWKLRLPGYTTQVQEPCEPAAQLQRQIPFTEEIENNQTNIPIRQEYQQIQPRNWQIADAPSPSSNYYSDQGDHQPQPANHQNWRAVYGVSGSVASELQNRSDQLQEDVQNVTPEGKWRPNSGNIRNWHSQFDDPGMIEQLNRLQQNGIPSVFGPSKM